MFLLKRKIVFLYPVTATMLLPPNSFTPLTKTVIYHHKTHFSQTRPKENEAHQNPYTLPKIMNSDLVEIKLY